MKLPQTGGCQCGKIRYEITEEPQSVYLPGLPTPDQQRILLGDRCLRNGVPPDREYAPSPREFFICLSCPGPATIPDTRLFLSEGRFISPANSSTAAGFDAIWGSGFEPSVSSVVPDANILPVDTHLELMRTTGEVQDAPVIADIDTGCRRDAGDSRAHSTLQNTVDASSGPAAA